MKSTLLRTLLPALSVLVAAIALAQPTSEEGSESPPASSAAPLSAAAALTAPEAHADRPRPDRSSRRRTRRSRSVRSAEAARPRTPEPGSVSVGRHNRGRLLNGTELAAGDHLRLKHADGDQHHGTDELVGLLRGAAAQVWERAPGTPLTVGDLSRHHGGRFRPHRSHQNGRDVDVGFYIHDLEGAAVAANRFVDFGPLGTTRHDPNWRFDDERNWLFVEYVLTQTEAPVQYMFVSRELRRRLLAEGSRRGADPEILARAARVLYQPPAGGRHRDHFHMRIYCDANDMPRCRDDGPRHPWLRGSSALSDAASRGETGLEDVVAAVAFFSAPVDEGAVVEEEEAPRARSRGRSRRSRSRSRRSRR